MFGDWSTSMARNQRKVGEAKSITIAELPAACTDEAAAVAFIEKQRWGDTPCCPHCGSVDVYQMKDRQTGHRNKDFRWRCRSCSALYTVRTGMVMEDSRIPLRHWCFAFWRACTSKKGVSAKEIQRQTGLSYKSSLFLLHRVRFAMAPTQQGPKLEGIVEVDETFIGGKPRYRLPPSKFLRGDRPSNFQTKKQRKSIVFAAVQRHGQVRCRVIPTINAANLYKAVTDHVDLSSRIITDECRAYGRVGKEYAAHDRIQHKNNVYVRGDITTNTVEGFFATLKRGINGIYHSVSKKHLQRYLDEFEFRYNHRKLEDGERVIAAMRGADGKRLRYEEPVPKKDRAA
jgi:transposase-like protein